MTLNNRQPLCAGAAAQRFGHSGDIRSALDKATLGALFWVIAIALLLRVTFYTGGMGSLEVAVRLLYGESVRTDYIGGIRYGFEIPAAFFLWLFGPSEISANIWSMVSSLLEVALIFLCALLLWGRRPAVLAGLVAAFLPQHVNIAGRMAADSPLALFITLSFVCFLIGELRSSKRWFFAAGLAVGAVFWVKHAVVPFAAAFLLYPIAARKWDWKWYWCVVGALLMLIGNSLLMWHMQGDPFHVFRIVGQGLGEYGGRTDIDAAALFYFRYLFIDIRHTWLLGYLALAGAIAGWRYSAPADARNAMLFPTVWAVGLLIVFSFTIVSWEPFRLIMKQQNYMVIFLAPLCVLSGYALASMRASWAIPVLVVYAVGGIVLAALVQQDIRAYGANSLPAVDYARAHPEKKVFVSAYAYRIADFEDSISTNRTGKPIVSPLSDLAVESSEGKPLTGVVPSARSRVAIIDTENLAWGRNPFTSLEQVPSCWRRIGQLDTPQVDGAGRYVVRLVAGFARYLPSPVSETIRYRLGALMKPKPAYVYEIPDDCSN